MNLPPSSVSLFYLSGTGNALKAVCRIEEAAQAAGMPCSVHSVDRIRKAPAEKIPAQGLTGLCYPTHGFSLPWHMLRFIWSMPRGRGRSYFLLNTRAGSKIGPVFLPGISGVAQWLPLLILFIKGYKCTGLLPLDMPSNWISLHPGFGRKTSEAISTHCMAMTERFATKVLSGRRYYRPIAFICIPVDVVLIPVALGYTIFGRFFLAKTFIADYTCSNCGLCIKNCPVGAIHSKFGRPFWTFDCESCMRCMNICPERSVQTAHGYIVILAAALLYIPFFALTSDYIMAFISTGFGPLDTLLDMTVFTVITIPFLYVSYYGLAWLQRFKWGSIFFRISAFTRYWKHYLAPGIGTGSFSKGKEKMTQK